ncbi:acyltransferase family protein [Rhizobiaceae bacterium BDR2-2]|uniref:Acyltransferase family protein n=1 Tax=Ectorhizobium quercum TaxID=2965071 RepID=A0AAE3N4B8_9HYPH|nr:acyltransferase family protein [Ectorhizobium quercum]MCX8999966.1 acyltransferase family protein [Ectorhizobium quercum]
MSGEQRREHGWDMLRALLMLLGIPYHASMTYNTAVLWDIHSPEQSAVLTFLGGVLVTFRMPAFFIVSGYFAAMMLARRPAGPWLKGRYIRLGVPFLTGLLLLAPPQLFFMNLAAGITHTVPTMDEALVHARSEILHPGVDWIMHLWFLPALMAYCTAAALCRSVAGTPAALMDRFRLWLERRRGIVFLAVMAVVMVWEMTLRAAFIELAGFGPGLPALAARGLDPYLRYLPYFALGALLRREPAVRHAFALPHGWVLPAATVLTAVIASLTRAGSGIFDLVNILSSAAAALMTSRLLIGYAHHHWNRPNRHVDRIVDASFTIYLLHHPIIYALATGFLLVAWPPTVEFLLTVAATGLLSYGAHRLIRRSRTALFLMNGIVPRNTTPRPETCGGTLR